jgi:hypothetical protein
MRAPRPETFEPEMLALLGAVYDDAWRTVAGGYDYADAETLAEARAELAAIMLRLAERQLASGELKDQAIRQFRQAMGTSATQRPTPTELAPAEAMPSCVSVQAN